MGVFLFCGFLGLDMVVPGMTPLTFTCFGVACKGFSKGLHSELVKLFVLISDGSSPCYLSRSLSCSLNSDSAFELESVLGTKLAFCLNHDFSRGGALPTRK